MVVAWQTAATTFLSLYKPARQGRKTAYITIATALVVLLSLGLGHLLPSTHGAPRKTEDQRLKTEVKLSLPASVFRLRL